MTQDNNSTNPQPLALSEDDLAAIRVWIDNNQALKKLAEACFVPRLLATIDELQAVVAAMEQSSAYQIGSAVINARIPPDMPTDAWDRVSMQDYLDLIDVCAQLRAQLAERDAALTALMGVVDRECYELDELANYLEAPRPTYDSHIAVRNVLTRISALRVAYATAKEVAGVPRKHQEDVANPAKSP